MAILDIKFSNKLEVIEALKKASDEFEERNGLELLLKANLGAINRMLIRRGRGQELLESFMEVTEGFEKSIEKTK